jgi:ATPase subunit of ABC transporter with duplicated ATPase domains
LLGAADVYDGFAAWTPGVDEPDSGAVRCKGTRIGYLPQTPDIDEECSAIDAVLNSDSAVARCVRQYDEAMASKDQKACSYLSWVPVASANAPAVQKSDDGFQILLLQGLNHTVVFIFKAILFSGITLHRQQMRQ